MKHAKDSIDIYYNTADGPWDGLYTLFRQYDKSWTFCINVVVFIACMVLHEGKQGEL